MSIHIKKRVKANIKPQHNWEVNEESPGMYDTTYQCTICKKWHTVSADNIASNLPRYGCTYKVQSDLQKLNSLTNWVVYFLLREFPSHYAHRLGSTQETLLIIDHYNGVVRELKAHIELDYINNKARILEIRAERKEKG